MPISLSSCITISSNILAQEVDGETVLLDFQSENYFGLDGVGTQAWQLLQEHTELQKIFDILLKKYDVDAQQLENDLSDLIEKLLFEKLITVDPATT